MRPELDDIEKCPLFDPDRLYDRLSPVSWSVADTFSTFVPVLRFSSIVVEYGLPRNVGRSLLLVIVIVNVVVTSPPLLSDAFTKIKQNYMF